MSTSGGSWHPHPLIVSVIAFSIAWFRVYGSITIAGSFSIHMIKAIAITVIFCSCTKLVNVIISILLSSFVRLKILLKIIILSCVNFPTTVVNSYKLIKRFITIAS